MKGAKKEQPLWDYYYDKQLETLLREYEFDFERVADAFNAITENDRYTKELCEERYTQLYEEKKKGQYSSIAEELLLAAEGKKKKKTIYEKFQDMPYERTAKNYLKVTPEDLENAFSVSAITGEIIRPTGNAISTRSGFNIFTDKLFSDEYKAEKKKREEEFLKSLDITAELEKLVKEDTGHANSETDSPVDLKKSFHMYRRLLTQVLHRPYSGR
jgi:hypothetical protein